MDDLFSFFDTLLDIDDLREKYGWKGCLLMILLVVAIVALVIGLVWWLGS